MDGGANKFLSMHDTLLFYTKQPRDYVFNPLFTSYTEKSLARKKRKELLKKILALSRLLLILKAPRLLNFLKKERPTLSRCS